MFLPHARWIEVLVLSGKSNNDIKTLSGTTGLPVPTSEHLDTVRECYTNDGINTPFSVNATNVAWAVRRGINSALLNKQLFNDVLVIQHNRQKRRTLRTLLLGNIPIDMIVTALDDLFDLNKQKVSLFKHYFWDTKELSHNALYSAFAFDDLDSNYYKFALRNQGVIEILLWKLGFKDHVEESDAVELMLYEASNRFNETRLMANNKDTALTAKLWSEIANGALDRKALSNSEIKQLVAELRALRAKPADSNDKLRSIDSVTTSF